MPLKHCLVQPDDRTSLTMVHRILNDAGREMAENEGLFHWAREYPLERLILDSSERDVVLVSIDDTDIPVATYQLHIGVTDRSDGAPWAQIDKFATHPSRTGEGIGTRVLKDIRQNCERVGAAAITLDVYAESSRAIRFYERNGFAKVRLTRTKRFQVWNMQVSVGHQEVTFGSASSGDHST